MSFKDFILGYRPGREITPDEFVIQSATVTLIDGPPASLDEESLKILGGIPPTGDEHLVLTNNFLVYKTDYEFINALLQGLEWGSKKWGPPLTGAFWSYVRKFIDPSDQSFWIPYEEVQAITPYCQEIELSWLLGSSSVAHYCYQVDLASGSLWFLQTPVGRGGARQFQAMVDALS